MTRLNFTASRYGSLFAICVKHLTFFLKFWNKRTHYRLSKWKIYYPNLPEECPCFSWSLKFSDESVRRTGLGPRVRNGMTSSQKTTGTSLLVSPESLWLLLVEENDLDPLCRDHSRRWKKGGFFLFLLVLKLIVEYYMDRHPSDEILSSKES